MNTYPAIRPNWTAVRLVAVCLCAAWVAAGFVLAANGQEVGAAATHSAVSITRASRVRTSETSEAMSVSFTYDFRGLQSVRLDGVGLVAASGAFTFVTGADDLTFRDAETGAVLASTPITPTVIVAARPPLQEIAVEAEFPRAFRVLGTPSGAFTRARLNEVLSRQFSYVPEERLGQTVIITTFAPVELTRPARGAFAQVALRITLIDGADGAPASTLRIQSLVREGRSHSDELRPTSNAQITRDADAFVDRLLAEMAPSAREASP